MYDIIIIGAGTAGIAAYKEAIKYTDNILIINEGPWDTTCARVGCMPSKVLLSVANRANDIKHADDLSLIVEHTIDTSKVMQHVRSLRDRFTRATIRDVDSWPEKHKISGKAYFIDSQTIEVNQQAYQAKSFIVAVGSKPTVLPEWKASLGNKLITSDEIFELEALPKSLAVLGSGVIAVELAQAMQRLNVKTTVFARSRRVGVLSSPNLQPLAQTELSKELNFKFQILPESFRIKDDQVEIHYIENGQKEVLYADYVLAATGRTTLLNSVKLENINTEFSNLKQLPLNPETKQLADLPIFIVGDAQTTTPVQHEAAHEGRGVVHSCLNFPTVKNVKTLTPLGIAFSSPEMAMVGQTYKQLTDAQVDFVTGFSSYEKQGRAIVNAKNKGGVELYVDKQSRQLLGAELLTESAEHLAHLLAWCVDDKLTIDEILKKPFYHPTIEEGLRTALKHARRQLN